MLRKFRKKPAYYSVHAMRDGTIWLAVPHRKPYGKKSVTDEDGIFQWFLEEDIPSGMYDGAKCVQDTTVTTSLNVKRIVRNQVEPKLDLILERLDEIQKRLERLEKGAGRSA
jgi:hypothetical protein